MLPLVTNQKKGSILDTLIVTAALFVGFAWLMKWKDDLTGTSWKDVIESGDLLSAQHLLKWGPDINSTCIVTECYRGSTYSRDLRGTMEQHTPLSYARYIESIRNSWGNAGNIGKMIKFLHDAGARDRAEDISHLHTTDRINVRGLQAQVMNRPPVPALILRDFRAQNADSSPVIQRELNRLPIVRSGDFAERLNCPITGNLMIDPVIVVASGQTYDRQAIERWFARSDLDPVTNVTVTSKQLIKNAVIQQIILDRIQELRSTNTMPNPVTLQQNRSFSP